MIKIENLKLFSFWSERTGVVHVWVCVCVHSLWGAHGLCLPGIQVCWKPVVSSVLCGWRHGGGTLLSLGALLFLHDHFCPANWLCLPTQRLPWIFIPKYVVKRKIFGEKISIWNYRGHVCHARVWLQLMGPVCEAAVCWPLLYNWGSCTRGGCTEPCVW